MNREKESQESSLLTQIAYSSMEEKGMLTDFSEAILNEVQAISESAPPLKTNKTADLRDWLFFSIDNDDSKDLDQLTFAKTTADGGYKIYIAVADVDGLVKPGSEIDRHAANNTTSVYTPSKIFSMLPLELSTNLTSLNEGVDRACLVVEVDVRASGDIALADLYPALVCNKAQLAYNNVAAFLDGEAELAKKSVDQELLIRQLRLQDSIAELLNKKRLMEGELVFASLKVKPVLEKGVAVDLKAETQNRAQKIIEHFMIAANISAAKYLETKGYPTLSRIVKTPKNWDRIVDLAAEKGFSLPLKPNVIALQNFLNVQKEQKPDEFYDLSLAIIKLVGRGEYVVATSKDPSPGHFDLALKDYCHSTAPNRRYPDLIVQRLIKSELSKKPIPYQLSELDTIAKNCTDKEDAATKIERKLVKCAAAMVLSNQIGKTFKALVTGATDKGIWVRINEPPVEGKLMKTKRKVDVGDHLTVKLLAVDIEKGFIDFIED